MPGTDTTGEAGDDHAIHAAIAELPEPFDAMGTQLHELITEHAPMLTPRTWYGMPAYELVGVTICFFRADGDYMTFGFTEHADLSPDPDAPHQLIASAWFFTELDEATAAELADIVQTALQ